MKNSTEQPNGLPHYGTLYEHQLKIYDAQPRTSYMLAETLPDDLSGLSAGDRLDIVQCGSDFILSKDSTRIGRLKRPFDVLTGALASFGDTLYASVFALSDTQSVRFLYVEIFIKKEKD
ncbi:MAG TPA: hypothetical protein PLT66_01025 [Bacillota bacterium]|nr:hypothetical protein [Bacillota bacterium]